MQTKPSIVFVSRQSQFPVTDIFSHIDIADGRVWMLPKGVACFAGDLAEAEQKVVWATHAAPAADLFNQKVIQDEATREESKSKAPMFRTSVPRYPDLASRA